MHVAIDEPSEGVRILTLRNERKRNAVGPALLEALADAVVAADRDGVRCLVITGAGDRAFCAGYDLDLLRDAPPDEQAHLPDALLQQTLQTIERAAPPVIAAINGHAYGAGAELATACDLRIASSSARLAMPPAKLGIVYDPAGLQRFVDLVGLAWTRRLFYTGDPVEAERAREIGLVDEVVPQAEVLGEAITLAERIAKNSPLAVQGMKRILSLTRRRELPAAAVAEVEALRRASFSSPDAKEGIAAALERRTPRFF